MMGRFLKKFRKNDSGNFATIFALAALPMAITMGGAVDILRVSTSNAKLQAAVESSVLAAASLTNRLPVEEAVRQYVEANVGDDPFFKNLQIFIETEEISLNKRVVKVRAEANLPMTFLGLIGINEKQLEVHAEAIESIDELEIAMVLDVSSSMSGARLTNLQTASNQFIDEMLNPRALDKTSINLVPFGGTVNLGSIFDDYAVDTSQAIMNPDQWEYNRGYNITNKKYRFTNGRKCVEVRREDFDLDIIPAKSRSQVPHFWKYRDFNPWCPEDTSGAIWNTNNAQTLKDRVNEFSLSDGTGIDHGLLWGAKALSPDYKGKLGGDFPNRPNKFNKDTENYTQKIMVLMTDGGITSQFRPKDVTRQSVHTWRKNKKNQQTLLSAGNVNHPSTSNSGNGNVKKICEDLKAEGVMIYTIGFQIKPNSSQEKILEYCASNPANYYLVETLDIGEAFEAIAISIQKLRISG